MASPPSCHSRHKGFYAVRYMRPTIPIFVQQELQRLPLYCGVAWLPSGSHPPVFAVTVPDEAFTFFESFIHYLPPLLHSSGEGTLLEIPFDLSYQKAASTLRFSLLLHPGSIEHLHLLQSLEFLQSLDLFAYTPATFNFCGQRRTAWPEMYHRKIQEMLQLPWSPTRWEAVTHSWITEVYQQRSHPIIPQARLASMHPLSPASQHGPLQPQRTAAKPEAVSPPTTRKPSAASPSPEPPILPASLQTALAQLRPLHDLLWYRDTHNTLFCLMTLPSTVRFADVTLKYALAASSPEYIPEGPLIYLPFSVQPGPRLTTIKGVSMFNPSSPDDQQLLRQLSLTDRVQLLGYAFNAHGGQPTYLGKKDLTLKAKKRIALGSLLDQPRPPTQWPEAKERWLREKQPPSPSSLPTKEVEATEQGQWPLPKHWKQVLRSPNHLAIMTVAGEQSTLPRILVKVPPETRFEQVAVAFHSLNLYTYTHDLLLCLRLVLQNSEGFVLHVDCPFPPLSDRTTLLSCISATAIEVIAIADIPELTVLGAKQFQWPRQKRARARELFTYLRRHPSTGSWERALDRRLETYPPERSFHPPSAQQPLLQKQHYQAQNRSLDKEASVGQQQGLSVQEHASPVPFSPSSGTSAKPIIVAHALLIDRYLTRQEEVIAQTSSPLQYERADQTRQSVEQAHKYVWMHSAWLMVEALRHHTESHEDLLRLPAQHIYIELEQPREICGGQFAACSFLHLSEDAHMVQRWQYAIVDREGRTRWLMFYEHHVNTRQEVWTLPKEYQCPTQQCRVKQTTSGILFCLCALCQEKVSFYSSWLTVALRMLAGDFQECLEMQKPEEIFETSMKSEQDATSGQIKEKRVLRRFRVVGYYDACTHREATPRNKRGSWMSNKPLAESAYDVNPHAIIYVQIQPRDHTRTYKHERYVHMQGKTQRIDPKPRLQPMTIARFRQLPQRQRITRVYASSFDG